MLVFDIILSLFLISGAVIFLAVVFKNKSFHSQSRFLGVTIMTALRGVETLLTLMAVALAWFLFSSGGLS